MPAGRHLAKRLDCAVCRNPGSVRRNNNRKHLFASREKRRDMSAHLLGFDLKEIRLKLINRAILYSSNVRTHDCGRRVHGALHCFIELEQSLISHSREFLGINPITYKCIICLVHRVYSLHDLRVLEFPLDRQELLTTLHLKGPGGNVVA